MGFCLGVAVRVVLFISVVRLSRKKGPVSTCEFGSVSKYVSGSLEFFFLNLHQSDDLYLNTL